MDAVFQKWCDKLLDTGKSNRLINYKETKMRTLEILKPSPSEVFNKISAGQTLNFYEIDDFIRRLKDEDIVSEESQADDEGKFDRVNKQQILEAVDGKLSKNEILSFKKGFTLRSILKNLKTIANSSITEKGINILYMTFGMLSWTESDISNYKYKSPLILIPVVIDNESRSLPYTIKQYEDDITTNPTLLYKMEHEFGINIPIFQDDENNEESLEGYLERVQNVVSKYNWDVSDDITIGTFSFLKINMYKDLVGNEKKILSNPTIKKLLNRATTEERESDYYDPDTEINTDTEITLHNVVDADSSQMSAILQAKKGNSFVLQGPPGTGKSQTITNLIAEFLHDGKKVLFVSEKLAALNVVYSNLKKAGLSDFCLELHSNKTNKKDVVDELYRVLSGNQKLLKSGAADELDELRKIKNQLDVYAETMHTIQPCINKTPYQILGAISKYRKIPAFDYVIESIGNKNLEFLKEASSIIESIEKFSENMEYDYRENCWYGYSCGDLTYENKIKVKNLLNQCENFLIQIKTKTNNLKNNVGIEYNKINEIQSNIKLLEVIKDLEFFDTSIFKVNTLNTLLKHITAYNKTIQEIKDKQDELFDI